MDCKKRSFPVEPQTENGSDRSLRFKLAPGDSYGRHEPPLTN
jgi:hypothetical protein